MKQPERGGRYIFDPETNALTKVERGKPPTEATPSDETPTVTQQATGAAKRGK